MLEIENQNIAASPKNANAFFAPTVEFEYGVTAWWTAEAYVQGQVTANDSAVFTGFRFESRFRPLPREYWINPVFYVEYEDVNKADKSFLEITGNDSIATLQVPNAILSKELERTIETKLILSSNVKGWNLSENFIAEKALNESEPWEFGYALAGSRPLALAGSEKPCVFCRQNISAGAELFGGLGTADGFGVGQTEQYLAPTVALNTPSGFTYKFSPEFWIEATTPPRFCGASVSPMKSPNSVIGSGGRNESPQLPCFDTLDRVAHRIPHRVLDVLRQSRRLVAQKSARGRPRARESLCGRPDRRCSRRKYLSQQLREMPRRKCRRQRLPAEPQERPHPAGNRRRPRLAA